MVPIPPSQARIADFQPLSCQAIALTRLIGSAGILSVPPALRFSVRGLPAAVASAAETSAVAALVPVKLGAQPLCAGGVCAICGGCGATGPGLATGAGGALAGCGLAAVGAGLAPEPPRVALGVAPRVGLALCEAEADAEAEGEAEAEAEAEGEAESVGVALAESVVLAAATEVGASATVTCSGLLDPEPPVSA
ncbi:hypothetical protein GCM10009738_76680 [Kitasatospora viridis]